MGALVRNVSSVDELEDLVIPTKADGSFYRFEMVADGGWSRYYDDAPDALVDFLVPGYLGLDDQGRLDARVRYAVDLQVRLQARLNTFFADTERSDDEQLVLTGPRHLQPAIEEWGCAVPLVLIDAFYAPYADLPVPVSPIADVAIPPNLWWLRPAHSDLEFLRSLHECSLIDLHVSKDEVA